MVNAKSSLLLMAVFMLETLKLSKTLKFHGVNTEKSRSKIWLGYLLCELILCNLEHSTHDLLYIQDFSVNPPKT